MLLFFGIAIVIVMIVVTVVFIMHSPIDHTMEIIEHARNSVVRIQTAQGLGTGFVVASRGDRHLILTNHHVLEVEEGFIFTNTRIPPQCQVVISSGETIPGQFVGQPLDSDIDLALVVVETPFLSPVKIGRFYNVSVGERVVAIGNPQGLDFSATQGIVSAKRSGYLLQTDAAINHGNSGGPLYDEQGRVIGVNFMFLSDSQNIGFAVRADFILDPGKWDFVPKIDDLMSRIKQ